MFCLIDSTVSYANESILCIINELIIKYVLYCEIILNDNIPLISLFCHGRQWMYLTAPPHATFHQVGPHRPQSTAHGPRSAVRGPHEPKVFRVHFVNSTHNGHENAFLLFVFYFHSASLFFPILVHIYLRARICAKCARAEESSKSC